MQHFSSPRELVNLAGTTFEPSEWMTITQETIDAFAQATGDHQWIHVDVERAKREAPGGKTIAHGYLLMSLLGTLMPQILEVKSDRILNYGSNKTRFLAAVPVDSRVRLVLTLKETEETPAGLRVTYGVTFELEGAPKPAMISEILFVYG
ncbi:MaoC family dehydratase [Martelella sp. FLE1502]